MLITNHSDNHFQPV